MKGIYNKSLMIVCIISVAVPCMGQTIEVSDPSLQLKDNVLQISYDILNSDPSDVFQVSLRITTEDGAQIPAKSLTGDIGENVSGGHNKLISWNLSADKIAMNSRIFVKVYVKSIRPPVSLPEVTADGYTRASLLAQSIPLPGLGLTRLTSNPHWIRGAIGYGCIGGSIAFNRRAQHTYNLIPANLEYEDKNRLYEKSLRQDNLSEFLAYAAIGIWITDIIWTVVGTSDLNKLPEISGIHGIRIHTGMDPVTNVPLMGFRYNF